MTRTEPEGPRRPPVAAAVPRGRAATGGRQRWQQVVVATLAIAVLVAVSQSAARSATASEPVELVAASIEPRPTPNVLRQQPTSVDARNEVEALLAADETRQERERAAEEAEAAEQARADAEEPEPEPEPERPAYAKPAEGRFTSGFGARWGSTHNGIDIANSIGTPILAVTEGTVVEAGPASGFGLWVQLRHDDGTVTVYGHMDRILVGEGQRVSTGEQIATMGNRGQSTGPHLHFEVWQGGQTPIDPVPWLAERGISVG
ncbi:M23 family metallopeptidase [Haloechinothrix sp. LS1_15]|uniref:M23 family metallopeptidase n=1 Tax=Haloechinothrix sp. LS1_15 TaxID=2652248 RepID=UPI00294ACFB1|nr:M23 family metallopeptidase [Haloechinothrix sp. LS1_15]